MDRTSTAAPTPPCCPTEEEHSTTHLAVYLALAAAAFLLCVALVLCWSRRRIGWLSARVRWARTKPPSPGHVPSHPWLRADPDPDPDPYPYPYPYPEPVRSPRRAPSAHYENVMLPAWDVAEHRAQSAKSDQESEEYDNMSRLAEEEEEGIYNNVASTSIYCNHPMRGLAQDDTDSTYVFPDWLHTTL